jgi:hypothetical protein
MVLIAYRHGLRPVEAVTLRWDARELLAPVYGWFADEGFDTRDLKEAMARSVV